MVRVRGQGPQPRNRSLISLAQSAGKSSHSRPDSYASKGLLTRMIVGWHLSENLDPERAPPSKEKEWHGVYATNATSA